VLQNNAGGTRGVFREVCHLGSAATSNGSDRVLSFVVLPHVAVGSRVCIGMAGKLLNSS
jgi:hypothetical protein